MRKSKIMSVGYSLRGLPLLNWGVQVRSRENTKLGKKEFIDMGMIQDITHRQGPWNQCQYAIHWLLEAWEK